MCEDGHDVEEDLSEHGHNVEEDLMEIGAKFETLRNLAVDMLDYIDKEIRRKAGAKYQELLSNYDLCKQIVLTSNESDLCWAAIQLLLHHSEVRSEIRSDTAKFCEAVLLDSEKPAKVRALAARGLYNFYQTARDPHLPRLFLNLIIDRGKHPYPVVRVCYFNLLDMLEIPIDKRPKYSTFSMDEDVDIAYLALADQKIAQATLGVGGLKGLLSRSRDGEKGDTEKRLP